MNDELKEQLSALVDDELRREESGFLCRRVAQHAAAVEQLGRYFMISDALRRQLPETGDCRLAERLAAALENEPALHGGRTDLARRLVRPLMGLGVAASVAMVAVTLWSPDASGPVPTPGGQPAFVAAVAPAPSMAQPVALHSQTTTRRAGPFGPQPASDSAWERLDPDIQHRLDAYLINHSGHSSAGQFGGVLNYVRIAGQPERE